MKKYLIFDLDGTLIQSMTESVNIVKNYLKKKFNHLDDDHITYYINQTAGTPLLTQLEAILKDEKDIDIKDVCDQIYLELAKHESDFFEGVPEKIKELSKDYKLFLTTGNSTMVAKKYLKQGDIYDLFELAIGSDRVLKGNDHLEYFENYSNDPDFFENSFYIGDGNSDREFAKAKNIDFIHIGNTGIDKYEIKSVVDIDNILNKYLNINL